MLLLLIAKNVYLRMLALARQSRVADFETLELFERLLCRTSNEYVDELTHSIPRARQIKCKSMSSIQKRRRIRIETPQVSLNPFP